MTLGPSLCPICARNRHGSALDADGIPVGTCDAFPDGIPVAIFAGGHDHRRPFTDDPDELLFTPEAGVTAAAIEEALR